MESIINRDEVKTQLDALANDIAKSGDTKAANRLRNLRDAVDGGNQADAWASADINKLINPEQIVEYYKNQPIADSAASKLEFVRNILIFLPLLVSWFGISQAVSKYGDFLGKNQDQLTQPFLYLWQTGFGNQLPSVYRLGFLAGLDAVLILLLVGVSVGHSFLADLGKQGRFKEAERLRSDLSNALAGATLCLATRNRQQPTNVADAFDRTARLFGETTEKLLKRIDALAQTQQQDHQIFATLSGELRTIMGTITRTVIDLKTSNDALRLSMGQLATPVMKISTTLDTVATSSQELITLYTSQLSALKPILDTLKQWGTALQATLSKLDTAVNAGRTLANTVDASTRLNQTLHNALTQQLADQSSLNKNMIVSTADMKQYVSGISQSLVEYRALNREIDDLIRRLAHLAPKQSTRP